MRAAQARQPAHHTFVGPARQTVFVLRRGRPHPPVHTCVKKAGLAPKRSLLQDSGERRRAGCLLTKTDPRGLELLGHAQMVPLQDTRDAGRDCADRRCVPFRAHRPDQLLLEAVTKPLLAQPEERRHPVAVRTHRETRPRRPRQQPARSRKKRAIGARELARSARNGLLVGLLFIDIDHFKEINDGHGHETGDLVLTEVCRRLTARLRTEDLLGRIGGDEFAAIITDIGNDHALQKLADTLCQTVREPTIPGRDETLSVTVSVGGATSDAWPEPNDLRRAADRALYAAKAQRRDCGVVTLDAATTASNGDRHAA